MKTMTVLILSVLTTGTVSAGAFTYNPYAEILTAYVDNEGLVNYTALK